ncbi:hypothetical protein BGZ94_010054 [Podila epigama]|nr:hypothetical protein BGZ94_010054 [Podila epigama]
MAPESKKSRPVFQLFERNDEYRPRRLPTQVCPESNKRYVPWKDVQAAFKDVDYMNLDGERAVFMTDASSNIILPLRVPFSKATYEVMILDNSDQGIYFDYESDDHSDDNDTKKEQQKEEEGDDDEKEERTSMPVCLKRLYMATAAHYDFAKSYVGKKRDDFAARLANARYWSSTLRAKIDEHLKDGTLTEKHIALKDKMLAKIDRLEEKTSEWDYNNICFHTSRQLDSYILSPASTLFLVLPSDLATWDDANPATHSFRCYFICEMRKYDKNLISPKQFHLADHPGYDIVRQNEFFERYGCHSLRILQMVRQGFFDDRVETPPLDTFGILWGSTTETPAHGLSKDNITDLVAKSIDYLKRLPRPKKKDEICLSFKDIGEVKEYLRVPENDDGRGDLYRYTNKEGTAWICSTHLYELLDPTAQENLQSFVAAHGGNVNLRHGQVTVVLRSESEANEFVDIMKKCTSRLNMGVKLAWPATREFLRHLLASLNQTEMLWVEFDGVLPDVQPQNTVEYKSDLFMDAELHLLTLLNFPKPGEQCTYIGTTDGFQFQSKIHKNCPPFCWIEKSLEFSMAYDSDEDQRSDSDNEESDSDDEDGRHARALGEKHLMTTSGSLAAFMSESMPPPSKISGVFNKRVETVALQTGLIDLHLRGDLIPALKPEKCRSVQQLTVEAVVPLFEPEFEDLFHCCIHLEEVNVVVHEALLALIVEQLAKHWRGDSGSSLLVTLFERPVDEDEKSRILVQIAVGGRTIRPGGHTSDREVDTLKYGAGSTLLDDIAFKEIKCNQWNNDFVKTPLTPFQAELLDTMTATSALSLTNFKLDIHDRLQDTLTPLQNTLRRSRIGCLRISCNPIEAHLHDVALQVLLSIEWSSVNLLVLAGQCVEHWIHLLGQVTTQGKDGGPRPLYLAIENTKVPPQPLTHSDALVLHQLIYSSPLEELHLSDIEFSHDQDRQLVLSAVGADVDVTMKDARWSV